MKIYFTGSHGSGKTTLCRYVSKKYNIPMITEMARTVLSERELNIDQLRVDIDLVDSYQEEVVMRQFQEEKKYKSFVSDRSFDGLAYAAQHSRILNKLINLPETKEYIENLKKDSCIFFVRPCRATLKQDGVRESVTWDGAVQIDAMIKFILEMYDLKYFQINIDSMQERIQFVDAVLLINNAKM